MTKRRREVLSQRSARDKTPLVTKQTNTAGRKPSPEDCGARDIHVALSSLQPQDALVLVRSSASGPTTAAALELTIDGAICLFTNFEALYEYALVQLLLAVTNDLGNELQSAGVRLWQDSDTTWGRKLVRSTFERRAFGRAAIRSMIH